MPGGERDDFLEETAFDPEGYMSQQKGKSKYDILNSKHSVCEGMLGVCRVEAAGGARGKEQEVRVESLLGNK